MLAAGLACAALSWLVGGAAQAQNFPSRPVTLIVPWPAGGSTDIVMRALATATEKHLGQSIVIENRPGGVRHARAGQMAATAKPDGYTVAQMPITVFRYPFMTEDRRSIPPTDFTYIIGVTGYTFGVVVKDDAPWKTFPEFLADAKANPGKINYGTPGAGTSLHITMEQIAKRRASSGRMSRSRAAPSRSTRSSAATSMRSRIRPAGRSWSMPASSGCW